MDWFSFSVTKRYVCIVLQNYVLCYVFRASKNLQINKKNNGKYLKPAPMEGVIIKQIKSKIEIKNNQQLQEPELSCLVYDI